MRKSPTFKQVITCEGCGNPAPRTGPVQRYCETCSTARDVRRKKLWSSSNGRRYDFRARSAIADAGRRINAPLKMTLFDGAGDEGLCWHAKVSVPFTWAASKNHIFSSARGNDGHIAKRKARVAFQQQLIERLISALDGEKISQNKVWIDIFVQKPNHKGDAINFVDAICDAVKQAIGVDDRWFSLRSVDWQIVKDNPLIYVGVGQPDTMARQACSSCGRLLTYDCFQQHKGTTNSIARNCKECCSARVRS